MSEANRSLFKLAKSLSLVQTLNATDGTVTDNEICNQNESQIVEISVQNYKYIIVVDFEATCWAESIEYKVKKSEIIEFPAVLLNLENGLIESEFHQYVIPTETPKLSEFCTNLTGITQNMVENGVPLQTAIKLFCDWIRHIIADKNIILPKTNVSNRNGNTAFVTWSDWDFRTCLETECQRKNIRKPNCFNQWIDLKKIYKFYYKYTPKSFDDALRHLNIIFNGRQHSGIDDSRNIARLAYKLVRDGATLNITKDLKPFMIYNKIC